MTTIDRVALVTGANKGIGLEIARQLAQAGVFVLVGARDLGRGQSAVEQLSSHGLAVAVVQLDVLDQASVSAAAAGISEQHSRLDILVNNAGVFDFSDGVPSSASLDAARRAMNTNTSAPWRSPRNAPAAAQVVCGADRQPVERPGVADLERRPLVSVLLGAGHRVQRI